MAQSGLNVLVDYFDNLEGVVLVLSDDKVIHRTLRAAVHKVVGTQRDCLGGTASRKAALEWLGKQTSREHPAIVLVEQQLNGTSGTDFIFTLSKMHPEVKVVLLTSEIESANLAYLHELGVVSVVVKPASINNFVEKMANAIRPPSGLSELVGRGKDLLERELYAEAESVAEEILSVKPGSPAALMLIGDIRLARGDHAGAVEAYHNAHKEAELYIEPLKRLVEAFRGLDDDQVLAFLKKLDFISPLNPDRKKEIGEIYFRKDERDRAEQYFDSCLEIVASEQPSLLTVFASKIADVVEQGSPDMGSKYLKKALDARGSRLGVEDIGTFNRLGISLRRQGRWQDAAKEYLRAIGIAPDDAGLYYNLALAWSDGNMRSDALKSIRKALELDPHLHMHNDSIALNVGNVFLLAGSPERAQPFYEVALDINAGCTKARTRLAEISRLIQRPNVS